jgi:DNA polymerase III subunit delta'
MSLPWLDEHKAAINARLDAGRFGHAPLIQGPEGVGKRELANWLIARLLCLAPEGAEPCGHCRSCQLLQTGTHPDYFEIDIPEDKQIIPVDLIRELIEKMQLTPTIGSHRAGLIVTADAMNRNAANALLKTLEEPSPGAWLLLCSDQPASLPATIRSRCQQVSVRPPGNEQAHEWLGTACQDVDPPRRDAALMLSGGAPLAARAMLEDGELDRGLTILEVLTDSRADRYSPAILEQWQQDAAATWQWLARWLALMMNRQRGVSIPELSLSGTLPENLPETGLARLWEQALEGRRGAVAGSLRQDLSLGKWLLEWESLTDSRSRD